MNMEEKKLNFCEFLKGCEGEEMFVPFRGTCTLQEVYKDEILFMKGEREVWIMGECATIASTGFSYIFPNEEAFIKNPLDAYSAWMEWKSERTPKRWRAKEGEIYWLIPTDGSPIVSNTEHFTKYQNKLYEFGNYFRTKEEAQQAAEAVRELLMKINT